MEWEAVVFDLDDTLYPERQYVTSGLRAVATWIEQVLGISERSCFEELCQLTELEKQGRTFDLWTELHGLDSNAWVPSMIRVYRCHRPRIFPYPDVAPVLQRMACRYRLGLVTDGYWETQRLKWSVLELAGFFREVVYSDEFGRENWKPNPLPFRAVLNRLGVPAERSVYVGDNPYKDFSGARRIGMRTIRLRRRDGLYRDVDLSGSDNVADAEATDLLETEVQLFMLSEPHFAPTS